MLDSPTYEGFPIRPLYTSLDTLAEQPLPGQWPFVRGGDALRDVKAGWKVAEDVPAPPAPQWRRQRRGAGGADRRGQRAGAAGRRVDGVAPADLDRLLEGVFLDLVPVILDAGADSPPPPMPCCRWWPTSTTTSGHGCPSTWAPIR